MDILARSEPLETVKKRPDTSAELKSQLILSEKLLTFAKNELHLKPGSAYSAYADLKRDHVVWNIFAAPELSLEPKEWSYPIVGALEYRGYFKEEDAQAEADKLKAQGYDVIVGGVDAYSTLGWFRDPLLNTFIHENELALAELIFHELAHRQLFRKGETAFNEALATAVSYHGVRQWLRSQGKTAELKKYEQLLVRRTEFYDHIDRARSDLETLYASTKTKDQKRRQKRQILDALQTDFRELRRRWKTKGGEHWLDQPLNNAHLVASATYHEHLPVFEDLIQQHNGDIKAFFKAAKKLPSLE